MRTRKYNAVEISLEIKKKLYTENKSLNTSGYLKKLSTEARNSDLFNKRSTTQSKTTTQIPSAKSHHKRKSFDAVNWVREVRKDIYKAGRKRK